MPTKESDDAKVRLGGRFHRLLGATLVSAIGTGMHAAALPSDFRISVSVCC